MLHIENLIYYVLKNEIHAVTVAAVHDSSWRLQHDSCSQKRGKYFHTWQSSSLSSQAHRWPAFPLRLQLSSCWLLRRNDMMAESSLPFPAPLGPASHSNKSLLLISGSILTGCRCEAKMSTSVLTAAGACGTLSFYFFPHLFCSHPEANVAWQEHAINVNSTMWSKNDSCTSHIDEKNSKHGLKM